MDCKIKNTQNMNKFLASFAILISTVYNAQAQNGYIKYNTYEKYLDKVEVFKGEIVPFLNSSSQNKINVIVGADTIKGLSKNSNSYSTIAISNIYRSRKKEFLQLIDNGKVSINATEIADTVTLISESGQQLTQLIQQREDNVNKSKLGKTFRLIFSSAPSIFYSTDDLTQKVEDNETPIEETEETGWAWWQIIFLSVIGLCIIGFGFRWFLKRRSSEKQTSQEPIKVKYHNNKSLDIFARDNHIDIYKLIQYNKGVIDKKYMSRNDSDQKKVQKDLNNKELIVGYKEKETRNETITKEGDSPKEPLGQTTNFGNNNELSDQLRLMQNTLISEIQKVSSSNNNQVEINRLGIKITELENKLKGLENDKTNSDLKLMQLQTEKSNLETNFQTANNEKNRVQNEIKDLKERVIAVEFLKGYSESVFTYLKYCQQVSSDAYNLYNKISQQNPKESFAAGHLLIKFQSAANSIPIGDWLRTVQDIKDSGATTNRKLTRSFTLLQNDGEKQKEFQRLLFSEVLTKYSSNILVLAEAFKNLSRFQVSSDIANEAQSTFGKHVTEIVSKAKSTGLDIKHVPLFESWEKYLGQVEDNGGERSLAYKEITGLEKGAIAEIVSYGVKTSIGDDTKTIIILA
jgi:hypothetical protein